MSITVSGEKELKRKLLSLGASMDDALLGGVILTANDIRTDAIKSIQAVSPGRQVQRVSQGGGDTYTHTAAAEDTAPNTDRGGLVRSIAVEVNKSGLYALVGSNLDYAGFLEMGTSKMGVRPWLEPALRKNRDNLNKNLSAAADAIIKAKSK